MYFYLPAWIPVFIQGVAAGMVISWFAYQAWKASLPEKKADKHCPTCNHHHYRP